MQTISYTEVNSYRRCPKSWEYKYKQGLKRKRKGIRLLRGSILHEMLDAYVERKIHGLKYEGPDPWDVLEGYAEEYGSYFEEEKELHGDIVGDCGKIFEGYLRKYRRDPLKYEESELGIELDLSVLGSGALPVKFVGFIDKIAVDPQLGMINVKGKIDGVCWDYGRAKAPTEPEILKSGALSKRKNLDCDVYTYRNAIRKAGLVEGDYADMLSHLEGKEDSFFERVFLPLPNNDMVVEVVNDFLQTTAEIQAKREDGRCSRSMSPFNCATCVKKSEYEARGDRNGS
jgi:hypothetical protein